MNFVLLVLESYIFAQLSFVHGFNLTQYLDEKLRQSKIELIKIHIQETAPVQDRLYNVQWDVSWRIPLTGDHQPFTINMFDGSFVLNGDRLMAPPLNDTVVALREIDRIKEYLAIKFIRSIIWENTTIYLLVCYERGLCSLHTGTRNDALRFRQTIGHTGIPMDAAFFTQGNRLFLVIANNARKFSVPSVIYRWSGTYMDIINEVMTIGAVSVTTFEHRESTIIIFAQSAIENPRINSEVYEFQDSKMVRIQFLSTDRPISVHHYIHGDFNFVLMINEFGPSNVLCWDGRELLDWFSFPKVESHSLLSIFYMDTSTFVVIAYDNVVELYKLHSITDWAIENVKLFKKGQKIVDMAVWINECKMIVMLVMKEKNIYWVEQWEAKIVSVPRENAVKDADATRKCLSKLMEMLRMRIPTLKEAEASWEYLLPSAENIMLSEPISIHKLIMQSGTVDSIEVDILGKDVLSPHEIKETLGEFERKVDNVVLKWQEIENETRLRASKAIKGNIVADDAFFDELQIDAMQVDFVNDTDIRSKDVVLSVVEQPANPLHTENIVVHNLEVESLCGIPSKYWTLQNNIANSLYASVNAPIDYVNDVVIISADLVVHNLKVKRLNETIIEEFVDDLFLINRSQKIRGNIIYTNWMYIKRLTTEMLFDVPVNKLMTKTTNQSYNQFYANLLYIENLYAETINGVPVETAARKSIHNVFKGEVNLFSLIVTEHLTADLNESLIIVPNEPPLQVYDNVTIDGNLYLRNIEVDRYATVFMDNVLVNLKDIFENFWTKSTNQTIAQEITFEKGLTIDNLNVEYLNGFTEDNFLYTTVEEIPKDFINLHFENFSVNETFFENGNEGKFFDVNAESVTIYENLHLQNIRAKDIIALKYNGINVDNIMNGTQVNFTGNVRLPSIQAHHVSVNNLNLRLLNNRTVYFQDGLHIDDDHQISTIKVPEFHVQDLKLERLNGTPMSILYHMRHESNDSLSAITLEGDLNVENLTVALVDWRPTEEFLEKLVPNDVVITSEKSYDNLTVQDIILESLHGRNFDEFAANILSKSKQQTVSGCLSARVIVSDNITTNFINEKNASQLMWIDAPLTIVGNVTFTDLFVEGNINVEILNDRFVPELYANIFVIPAKNIDFLKVDESVSWNKSSSNPCSISHVLEHTVTKDTDQVITGNVIFEKAIHAEIVNSSDYQRIDTIRNIMSDAVIDSGETIEISGEKFFEYDFVTDILKINSDLAIPEINGVNILEFNNSIVRRDTEETISGPVIFTDEVKIEKLYANDTALNKSLSAAVRVDQLLPENIFFENLVITQYMHLDYLDGIDFDEFLKKRITLRADHNISCDMSFSSDIMVLDKANIGKINGIRPSDFVLSGVNKLQKVSGVKIFEKDLLVDGNIDVPLINDVDMLGEYANSVPNDDDVDIFGDLIFNTDVQIQNMSTSGLMNSANLSSIITGLNEKTNKISPHFKSFEIIDQHINYSSQVSKTLQNVFFYLEAEEDLKIPAFGINKVDVMYLERITRLNMYGEQPGSFCGLSNHCPCSHQYVAELSEEGARTWRINSSQIVRNFHDPDGTFGVNVITNAVSSSKECTSKNVQEFTRISLMKVGTADFGETVPLIEDMPDKIEGYFKDVKIFKHDGDVYIVLPMYYDKVHSTHRTNSLLYKLDVATGNVTLIQKIPMDSPWSIHIFRIDRDNIYLLVACFSDSSKSLLYKFDPTMRKFEQTKRFASRSRYAKNIAQEKDHFILLDNPDMNAVNIFKYDHKLGEFNSYQSIFHDRHINSIECFYIGDVGHSDAYVIVTTEGGQFYIYEYMFAGKFQLRLRQIVDGLQTMMPFSYMNRQYILAGTKNNNTIFRIVKQGPS